MIVNKKCHCQVPASSSPGAKLHHHYHYQHQQPTDYIPRSHERQTHPYWAVESIRQALNAACQSPVSHCHSLQPDTAAGGLVANGNCEMRDQATNTDITSECKLSTSICFY